MRDAILFGVAVFLIMAGVAVRNVAAATMVIQTTGEKILLVGQCPLRHGVSCIRHIVQDMETLNRIANLYHIRMDTLLKFNPQYRRNPRYIRPGWNVTIPAVYEKDAQELAVPRDTRVLARAKENTERPFIQDTQTIDTTGQTLDGIWASIRLREVMILQLQRTMSGKTDKAAERKIIEIGDQIEQLRLQYLQRTQQTSTMQTDSKNGGTAQPTAIFFWEWTNSFLGGFVSAAILFLSAWKKRFFYPLMLACKATREAWYNGFRDHSEAEIPPSLMKAFKASIISGGIPPWEKKSYTSNSTIAI